MSRFSNKGQDFFSLKWGLEILLFLSIVINKKNKKNNIFSILPLFKPENILIVCLLKTGRCWLEASAADFQANYPLVRLLETLLTYVTGVFLLPVA